MLAKSEFNFSLNIIFEFKKKELSRSAFLWKVSALQISKRKLASYTDEKVCSQNQPKIKF